MYKLSQNVKNVVHMYSLLFGLTYRSKLMQLTTIE